MGIQEAVMKRFAAWSLTLGLALLVPATVSAQKDNKYTKEASKFLGLAMAKEDTAQRTPLYQQALAQLQEGLAREPENAKVWLLLGQAHVGLNQLAAADSAFDKAVELHPEYAPETVSDREQGWIQGFNTGAEFMNQGKYPEAIAVLETAQQLYGERPEGLMNLGVLYMNANELDKAEASFEAARKTIAGPIAATLPEDQKPEWDRFDDMARINIAQLHGQRGVNAFQAKDFATAAGHFEKANQLNPHSRDFTFNLSQSLWAQASAIESTFDSLPEPQKAAAIQAATPQLMALYEKLDAVAAQVVAADPTNELLYIIRARAHRMLGEYSGSEQTLAARQTETVKLLEDREALPIELSDIMIQSVEGGATVRGTVKNRTLEPGATSTVRFVLVDIDGEVLGEQVLTMPMPEKDQTAPFEGTITMAGEVAGWKYSLN